MIKSIKAKINIAFIIILMIMTTMMSYKTYASTELSETYQNGKAVTHNNDGQITSDLSNYSEGMELISSQIGRTMPISFEKYLNDIFLFCSAHGVSLPGGSNTLIRIDPKTNQNLDGTRYEYPSAGENGEIILTEGQIVGMKFAKKEVAYFAKVVDKVCTPKAAYILNDTAGNTKTAANDDRNYVQLAWWQTKEGQEEGNSYDFQTDSKVSVDQRAKANSLMNTAIAYEDFVKRIADDVDDTSTYKTLTHTYENGETVSVMFPKLKEDKINSAVKFNKSDDIKVSFDKDEQKYLIGPFSIDYIESSTQVNNATAAEDIKFGALDNFNIYTDATGNEPVDREEFWEFVYPNGRVEGDTSVYPHANEIFYIKLDYIEGATKLTKMDVQYKYLIAGAQYQVLSGNYKEYLWSVKAVKNGDGTTTYKLTSDNKQLAPEAQKLSLINKYARWYETMVVSADFSESDREEKEGKISIYKKAIDENGNPLTSEQIRDIFGEDQYFDFKVTLKNGDDVITKDVIRVTAGATPVLKTYTWKTDSAPYFEVEELPSENSQWKVNSIEIEGDNSVKDNKKVHGFLTEGTTPIEITATNQLTNPYNNRIEITKTLSGKASEDEEFKFEVIVKMPNGEVDTQIASIIVPKGEKTGNVWLSKLYSWYGENAPTYEIEEIETKASKKYNPIITPSKGSLDGSKAKIEVKALNNEKDEKDKLGYLTIEKVLEEGQVTNDTFDFRVTVEGVKNTESGKMTFDVLDVKAGETKGPYEFVWQGDKAPTFTVEEINIDSEEARVKKITAETDNGKSVGKQDGNKITGELVENDTANVNVKFTNDMTKHSGGVKVIKEITTEEKISKETIAAEGKVKFDITVTVDGCFVYDGKTYNNEQMIITKTLPDNGNWEFSVDNIVWYGSEAPTFVVTENIPENVKKQGWKCKSIIYSDAGESVTESEGHSLIDDKTIDVTVLNELPSDIEIDLTFSMGGITWIDNTIDEKNNNEDGYYSKPNGVYDEKYDTLKENVEVTVYKMIYDASGNVVSREPAKAYKDEDKNEVTYPIVTKADGKWFVPRMPVAAVSEEQKAQNYTADYDVEFVYDGQTYEPTEFLSYQVAQDGTKTKNSGSNAEKAEGYKSATTSGRDKYAKDSMALEVSNNNSLIAEISGKTEIDSNGDTTGVATLTDGSQVVLNYHSDNAGNGYPTTSRLVTTDESGRTLEIFKAAATTSAGNLTFPFDGDADGSSLTNIDQYVDENGVHRKYKFIAVYNHCLNINLGLKQRDTVDIGLTKNLANAKVVVKERLYQYNYSGYFDLTEEKVNSLDKNIEVKDAQGSTNVEYTLGLYKSDYYYRAEMYKNGANTTIYDALDTFYKSINKTIVDTEMDVYLTYKIKVQNNNSEYSVKVNSIDDYYDSSFTLVRSEETKYLKTKTVGGVEQEVNGQYQVAKASDYADKWVDVRTGIVGSDKDANGKNIVYNKMTATGLDINLKPGDEKELLVTFKINKENTADAKNAIKLGQKCNVAEIGSYSTYFAGTDTLAGKIDRDSAPGNVNISANNNKAWYEDDTFAAPRIKVSLNGNAPERTINGLAWEDNSKDQNTENPGYNQKVGNGVMDSNEKTIEGLTTELVEKVIVQNPDRTFTEYDYIWPTDIGFESLNGKTIKELTGLESLTNTDADGKYKFVGIPTGSYVVRFTYGDKKIETVGESIAEYYNGQDFKSTQFNADLKNGAKVKADSYLDIDKLNTYADVKNTAIDSEVRRLEVVAKSREITNKNGSQMADYEGTALYDEYYMFADTPKLDMNIELSTFGKDGYKYDVNNVSFGLEERPQTELTLDKQIEEMTLTTSDGRTIMSAKYNIAYEVNDEGKVTAKVELDKENSFGIDNLQELNRDQAINNGFRYINIDTTILEGTTLNVKYKFTVLNTGEVDRTGKLAEDDIDFNAVCTELSTKLATFKTAGNVLVNETAMGDYVGNIYYYGEGENDKVVTTTVRQLVDYIDNDAQFSGMLNSTQNTSWSNISTAELKELVKAEIVKEIDGKEVVVDSNGVQYETENRNNLVVSVDSNDTSSELNNSGFIVELVPYKADSVDGKTYQASMNLTINRYVGSDMNDLQVENLAEIIKYNNKVGRKDKLSVPGNYDPSEELKTNILANDGTVSSGLVYERDTSATEVITMSPPTGAGLSIFKLQLIATISTALVIVAGGIVIIKKKVIK